MIIVEKRQLKYNLNVKKFIFLIVCCLIVMILCEAR